MADSAPPKTGNASDVASIATEVERGEKWMIVLTGFVALGTLFLAGAAFFQYLSSREQGKTADQQLAIIKQQAEVMRGELNSMQDQANSLRQQTSTLRDSLTETQKIVRQNERAVTAAETQARGSLLSVKAGQASVRLGEQSRLLAERSLMVNTRAYVMVQSVEAAGFGKVLVTIVNSGNTPAREVIGHVVLESRDKPLPDPFPVARPTPKTFLAWRSPDVWTEAREPTYQSFVGVIAPKNTLQGAITDNNFLFVFEPEPKDRGISTRYVWGTIAYKDIFGQAHKTIFCFFEDFGSKRFLYCSNNNEPD